MNGRSGSGGNGREPLAIVYATLAEAEPLLATLAARPLAGRPYAVFAATASAPRVIVAITGMGLAAAAAGIDAVLRHEAPREVVNAGIAGALHAGHAIGAVLRVAAVAEGDDDTLAAEAFAALDPAAIGWLAAPASSVRLVSRTAPLFDVRLRNRLARSADLVDMEGARIAARCAAAGVPCALIKAVSDHASDRVTLLANLDHGARRLAAFLAPPLHAAC